MDEAEITVDFLLDDLKLILGGTTSMILEQKDQIESMYEDLKVIRNLLKDTEESWHMHEELKSLVEDIRDVACRALKRFDWFVSTYFLSPDEISFAPKGSISCHRMNFYFGDFITRIKFIRNLVTEIYDKKLYLTSVPEDGVNRTSHSSRSNSPRAEEQEIVVGLDTEAEKIVEELTNLKKQLEVISIVGMAGIGKTTLAKKVYNDPLTVYHFHIRGWTYVSQVYQKRDVLIHILSSIVMSGDKRLHEMKDQELAEKLYKSLRGRRYLIVIDDLWDIGAWDDLKKSFPNDNNGSRIILTTRHNEVVLRISPNTTPQCLSFLNEDDSWYLLQKKAFPKETCLPELTEIGRQIAAKCKGLPLAIVVMGGLLATKEKTQEQWNQILESVGSYIAGEGEQFMDILEWSYNKLPRCLKPCFAYFGAFPEDYEIPVWKLIWSWIAEGYVQQLGQRSLEDVAEGYLLDLINRNLVLVAQKRLGQIETCRVHDMLRDLCLRKGKGKNYPQQQQLDWYVRPDKRSYSHFCVHSHGFHDILAKMCADCPPHVRCFYYRTPPRSNMGMSFFYNLIRVLDFYYMELHWFPEEISVLIHLKYLALTCNYISSSKYEGQLTLRRILRSLWNLQTLILHTLDTILLPSDLCNMEKLRHIRFPSRVRIGDDISYFGGISTPWDEEEPSTPVFENLQTISTLYVSTPCNAFLAKTPNLRKLELIHRKPSIPFPDLANLTGLETLTVSMGTPQPLKFPSNLKKLTLSETELDSEDMSSLQMLPNLEVLELRNDAFSGSRWETSEGGFLRLKFLKLDNLNLEQWIVTSSSHFPILQQLVMNECHCLDEIPSALGTTLEMIELYRPSASGANSARKIQEDQRDTGNDGLEIFIYGFTQTGQITA